MIRDTGVRISWAIMVKNLILASCTSFSLLAFSLFISAVCFFSVRLMMKRMTNPKAMQTNTKIEQFGSGGPIERRVDGDFQTGSFFIPYSVIIGRLYFEKDRFLRANWCKWPYFGSLHSSSLCQILPVYRRICFYWGYNSLKRHKAS